MLRITIHEDGNARRLELAGRLEGPWVAETENGWRALLRPGQKIEIDLQQLTSVDNAGRDLLAAFHRSGASRASDYPRYEMLMGVQIYHNHTSFFS